MTDLRDARLKQALEHAPDAHMAPDARTRSAILARAAAAASPVVVPLPREAWWRRWLDRMGGAGRPWNAAFATVLLACLVTLMWRDEEIPGAKMGDPPIAGEVAKPRVAEEAGGAAAPAAAQVPAPAAAPRAPLAQGAPPLKPAPVPQQRAQEQVQKAAEEATVRTQDASKDAMREKSAPVLQAPREDERLRNEAPVAATPAPVPVPAPAAAPAAPPAAVLSDRAGKAEQSVAGEASRSSGQLAGAAAARRAFVPPDLAALENWTQARVSVDGRVVLLERAPVEGLALQLRVFALAARSPGAMQVPVLARMELLRGGEALGVLAVGEAAVQWSPRDGAVVNGAVSAALVQEFLAEVRRLAR